MSQNIWFNDDDDIAALKKARALHEFMTGERINLGKMAGLIAKGWTKRNEARAIPVIVKREDG